MITMYTMTIECTRSGWCIRLSQSFTSWGPAPLGLRAASQVTHLGIAAAAAQFQVLQGMAFEKVKKHEKSWVETWCMVKTPETNPVQKKLCLDPWRCLLKQVANCSGSKGFQQTGPGRVWSDGTTKRGHKKGQDGLPN